MIVLLDDSVDFKVASRIYKMDSLLITFTTHFANDDNFATDERTDFITTGHTSCKTPIVPRDAGSTT